MHWFSTGCDFAPWGHLAMSGDIFGYHNWSEGGVATGIWSVQARDAAELPITHRTAPMTKNYPTQNASHAKVEKPYGIWIL